MTLKESTEIRTDVEKRPARNPNLDLIRCVSIVFVVSAHFFLNTGFYIIEAEGAGMAIAYVIRGGLVCCVPMFLLLTGYLCSHKRLSPSYFKGIVPTLTTYLLVCLILLLRKFFHSDHEINLWEEILEILDYGSGPIEYSWYVEMYIGLYLLIPFLNLIYHNLASKKEKQMLLGVFLFLTMAPRCFNDIDWLTPGFWRQLNLSTESQDILPAWWLDSWPLTYYFLGAYIREYDIKIPKWKNLGLLMLSVVVFGLFEFYRSLGFRFRDLHSSELGSLQNTLNGVLLFVFLLHLDLSRVPGRIISLIKWISKLSFGIYLCSDFSDKLVYPLFNQLPISFTLKYLCLPLMAFASFAVAAVFSQLVAWLQTFLFRMAGRLKQLWAQHQ